MKITTSKCISFAIIILAFTFLVISGIFFYIIYKDYNNKSEIYELIKEGKVCWEKYDSIISPKDSLCIRFGCHRHTTANSSQMQVRHLSDSISIRTDTLYVNTSTDTLNCENCLAETLDKMHKRLSNADNRTKELTNKFANIQFEIDLMIDKSSQWIGFWLSIIGIVLTITTILQAYANYRTNAESKETIKKTIHELELSTKSNKISCITSCISDIPELYNFAPEDTRRVFINKFLSILHNEYSDYIAYISETIPLEGLTTKELKKELDYVYLSWSQIEIALQNLICCYDEIGTNLEYQTMMMLLNDQISLYHNNGINSNNIVECMTKINDALNDFMKTIQ